MDLKEFITKFNELKQKRYVKSLRRGPTGIGKTLEEYIGIKENNLSLPDIENVEIKAHREGSNNMITLFTFNRGAWVMDPLVAVRKYGIKDKNGRLGLYFTMSFQPNSAGLYLFTDDNFVYIKHKDDGAVIAKWNFETLQKQFEKKIPALLLVKAKAKYYEEDEYFYFCHAELLRGTSSNIIKDGIKNGYILIDLRLHDKGTMARNHGTGFRTFEIYLPNLFEERQILVNDCD